MVDVAPQLSGSLSADEEPVCRYLTELYDRLAGLPDKPRRDEAQRRQAEDLLTKGRAVREEFFGRYAAEIYAEATEGGTRVLRADELVAAAGERFPGSVPVTKQFANQHGNLLKDKDTFEIDQALLIGHLLAHPTVGRQLLHAMSQPREEARERLDEFTTTGEVDLGPVSVRHADGVGYVGFQNHRFLNAEDDRSTDALEIAVDLVLLCDQVDVGVLRGEPATHPKWNGRRVFGAGINLTHLYEGRISLIDFFVNRELGPVDKMYRGHSLVADGDLELRNEKPWIAAVDSFAIGGGCQFLLVMDRVIAETGSYVNIPAGREGIIPGCGVLRLPRFVGEGVARQFVMLDRDCPVDSPDGRRLVSDVVEPEAMRQTVLDAVADFRTIGVHGLRANRKMLRMSAEPVDTFRRYMANYVRDQAYCVYNEALVRNLERNWMTQRQVRA